jgi:hypothetical protein
MAVLQNISVKHQARNRCAEGGPKAVAFGFQNEADAGRLCFISDIQFSKSK